VTAPVSVQHLPELMEVQATRRDRTVLYHYLSDGEETTFADLPVRAARVAGQLAARGVAPGDNVGVLAEDRAVFTDAFWGLQHLGAVPVPLGIAGRVGSEAWTTVLRDRIERLRIRALATDLASATALAPSLPGALVIGVDGSRGNPVPAGPVSDIAFIQPSSGTTGHPKGIVISQTAVLENLRSIGDQWEVDESDIGLSWLPLFHDMGLIGTVINALHIGGTLHQWPTESFLRSPGRWIGLLEELGVTIAIAPPFALELVTRRWRRRGGEADLSSVRTMLVGAEQIRPSVIEGFAEVFEPLGLRPEVICPTYGLAEATLAVSAKPLTSRFRTVEDGLHRWTSCGPAVPRVDLRLAPDTNELLVRTPAAMTGYLDDPAATAAAFTTGPDGSGPDGDRWLRTGDVAQLVDGEVVIVGRLKEMINRGGQRVAASDFELAVQGTEGILPDRVVAFGDVGDEGERVVVLAESRYKSSKAGEVVLALRSRLADAGLPADVVELVPAGFIPRTTSGKLRRGAARDRWQETVAVRSEARLPREVSALRVSDEG
jgi:acyl-CoA synthetase (AMP-forming)/AMP-acid ligase II